jgi:molecular chaperone GrpE
MSFSDETVPNEEVTPESESEVTAAADLGTDGTWTEADAAAVAAAPRDVVDGEVVEPLDPLVVLASERDEYLLALQRTQADFENYRKRIQRMQDEQSARSTSVLIGKLLPILDTLDLALAHQTEASAGNEDAKALAASRSMLLDTLSKEGLERVDVAGVVFDPEIHDAVAKVDGEGSAAGEPVIDEVLRSGYRWQGRVLRPAMVRVRG